MTTRAIPKTQGFNRKAPRALRLFLMFALVFTLIPVSIFISKKPAYGATGYLTIGAEVSYAEWSTNWMDVDGEIAYCGNPSAPTPYSGTYNKQPFSIAGDVDPYDYEMAYAIMYYGYGGPGFNTTMWPATWYDGSPWSAEKYLAITHINISDRYAYDATAALFGCSISFCQWWAWNFFSAPYWNNYYGNGAVENDNGFYRQAIQAWEQLPQSIRDAFKATVFVLQTGSYTQNIITWEKMLGDIELVKHSSNPSVSEGNSCYSLAGAIYDIYAGTSLVASMTTVLDENGNGYARSEMLSPGVYTVKERTAPMGYALDGAVYVITVLGGQSNRVNAEAGGIVYDVPGSGFAGVLVGKKDAETGEMLAQGEASLAGARFSVDYYDGYFASAAAAQASGAPTRSWVCETDENGLARLNLPPVSGQPYTNASGSIVLPYGTYVYYESKAPLGYLLPAAPEVFLTRIVYDGELVNGESPGWMPYTKVEGDQFPVEGNLANSDTMQEEQVVRGGVSIQKLDSETGATAQGAASFAGIRFSVVSENAGLVKVGNTLFSLGQVVASLTTDAAGFAATAADALPFGSYRIIEVATNSSYRNTSAPISFQIQQDGVMVALTAAAFSGFADEVVRGGVSIQKLDLETMLDSPLGGAGLDGASFGIFSRNAGPVLVDGVLYTNGQCVATLQTIHGLASTNNDTLPFGNYEIREIAAPNGYLLSDAVLSFSIRNDLEMVELKGDGGFANRVIRGDLEFVKIEAVSMKRMAYIPFEIQSKTTGERHVIVTDENGYASTASSWNLHSQDTNRGLSDRDGIWFGLAADGSLAPVDNARGALPFDTYTITELPCANNAGKRLLSFDVVISRNMVSVNLGTLTNDFSPKLEISKTDISGSNELAGAHLKLTRLADGALIDEWVSTTGPHLIEEILPGLYELEETIAPEGYLLSRETVVFAVLEGAPLTQASMTNALIPEISTSAIDAASGTK
ncbi:MAG: SpaA isopeptide-forming pilin-related protein, partial [Eggerthellaceae bacterium]|nr:SpaA isopeptide-forming pilin-related protein [Eggerthellaceae bacterium]